MNYPSSEHPYQKPVSEMIGEVHELVRTSENMKASLPNLIEILKIYFNCEAITIFAVDQSARQLYSTTHISDKIPEIRVDISLNNLAGYVAGTGNSLNIANVQDKEELAQYHPHLSHGSKWDPILEFVSNSMLVVPIPYKQNLIGILEVINKKTDMAFSDVDLKVVQEIAPALGLVMVRYYNDALKNSAQDELVADINGPDDLGQEDLGPENDIEDKVLLTRDIEDITDETYQTDESFEHSNSSIEVIAKDLSQQDDAIEIKDSNEILVENNSTVDERNDSQGNTEILLDGYEDECVSQEEEEGFHERRIDRRDENIRNEGKEIEIQKISQAIHEGEKVKEILSALKVSILDNFEAEDMTFYELNPSKTELYSTFHTQEPVKEIRLPISHNNIPGHVAKAKLPLNIENVENIEELKSHHTELELDDQEQGPDHNKPSEVLAVPVMHEEVLFGVLKIINKKNKTAFSQNDEKRAVIIAENLGYVLSKQEKNKVKPDKFSYLIENNFITEKELESSIAYAKSNNVDIETVLLDRVGLQRENLGASLESFYGIPYYGFEESVLLPAKILGGLNKNFLAKNFWLPIFTDNTNVVILINDPGNLDKLQNIKHIFPKKEIEFKVGLKVDLMDLLNSILEQDENYSAPVKTEKMSSLIDTLLEENSEVQVEIHSDENVDGVNEIKETDNAIIRLVNKVLTDAYELGATDIHVEPGIGKDNITIRFRKDGDCSIYEEIPCQYKHAIISRVKIMAQLDIAERRIPQDGKIKMRYGKVTIEFRVATCPTVGENEDIVLRILAKSESLPLQKMNFTEKNLQTIIKNVTTPYGLILVVGPTGSGKTTTLHSCLGHINTPRKKIWTVEDPVEITQKGIRQVQTIEKKGLDFPRAMRSFLRGDPDVIMVGEMRDKETASIGLEASLTGHLVFSTLHTNSAPETVTRLLDMGMNPLNFADSLLLVVAQRLIKTLCKKCREDYNPTQEEFITIVNEYGKEQFEKLGIIYDNNLTLKKPIGCSSCENTGYSGRTAIHEVLEGTPELKRQIVKQASGAELRKTAMEDGMNTLKQDGILKIFKGDCDLKQVLAVCII
jgi:type II secretory ATPase GspE/PulE/Tfp pilus assembly ATPase PilB-like protein/transcriptional regulator with GAF, ATPase, and Fis domain